MNLPGSLGAGYTQISPGSVAGPGSLSASDFVSFTVTSLDGYSFSFSAIGNANGDLSSLQFNNGLLTDIETAGAGAVSSTNASEHLQIHGSSFYQLLAWQRSQLFRNVHCRRPRGGRRAGAFHLGHDGSGFRWIGLHGLSRQEQGRSRRCLTTIRAIRKLRVDAVVFDPSCPSLDARVCGLPSCQSSQSAIGYSLRRGADTYLI